MVVWKGQKRGSEARGLGAIASCIAWGTRVLEKARKLGCESNDFSECLRHVFGHFRHNGSIELIPADFCNFHHSKTPGKAQFFARMRPAWVVSAALLWQQMTSAQRKVHWLGATMGHGDLRPLWKVHRYVLLGESDWETSAQHFPTPLRAGPRRGFISLPELLE